jgi:hypothetical protein
MTNFIYCEQPSPQGSSDEVLRELSDLSQRIDVAIQGEHWEVLQDILTQRHVLLDHFFSEEKTCLDVNSVTPEILENLQSMLLRDGQNIEMLSSLRSHLQESLTQIARGRMVLGEYHQTVKSPPFFLDKRF